MCRSDCRSDAWNPPLAREPAGLRAEGLLLYLRARRLKRGSRRATTRKLQRTALRSARRRRRRIGIDDAEFHRHACVEHPQLFAMDEIEQLLRFGVVDDELDFDRQRAGEL